MRATTRNSTRTWSASCASRAAISTAPDRRAIPAGHRSVLPRPVAGSRLCAQRHRPARRRHRRLPFERDRRLDLLRRYARGSVPALRYSADLGLKGAVFADAGTLFGYNGKRTTVRRERRRLHQRLSRRRRACSLTRRSPIGVEPECVNVRDKMTIRSSVGASILWNSPLGPIRFDYAYALSQGRGPEGCQRRRHLPRPRRQGSAPGVPLLRRLALLTTSAASFRGGGAL